MSHAKPRHHRPSLNDSLESINREGLPGKVKNHLCREVQDSVIASVQHVIEAALEEELSASLGWERYEHESWGRPPESTRSGSYQHTLITQYGSIADLHVPNAAVTEC
jgi:transposase-like protein